MAEGASVFHRVIEVNLGAVAGSGELVVSVFELRSEKITITSKYLSGFYLEEDALFPGQASSIN